MHIKLSPGGKLAKKLLNEILHFKKGTIILQGRGDFR